MSHFQQTPRYAIYCVPEPTSAFMQKASKWLGRDIFENRKTSFPKGLAISPENIETITKSPRHYGFHGTLKAPFRLAEGKNETQLEEAFRSFCKRQKAFLMPRRELAKIGSFHALICAKTSREIEELAGEVVKDFEPFRAPLEPHEIEKRNPVSLSERQRTYLMKWGYPYVFEEFRFHFTLTDKLDEPNKMIKEALAVWFEDVLDEPIKAGIALACQENRQSPFYVRHFATFDN